MCLSKCFYFHNCFSTMEETKLQIFILCLPKDVTTKVLNLHCVFTAKLKSLEVSFQRNFFREREKNEKFGPYVNLYSSLCGILWYMPWKFCRFQNDSARETSLSARKKENTSTYLFQMCRTTSAQINLNLLKTFVRLLTPSFKNK